MRASLFKKFLGLDRQMSLWNVNPNMKKMILRPVSANAQILEIRFFFFFFLIFNFFSFWILFIWESELEPEPGERLEAEAEGEGEVGFLLSREAPWRASYS